MQPQLSHFRAEGGAEIDIVLEAANAAIVGIEVKAHAYITGYLSGVRSLGDLAGKRFRSGMLLPTGHESRSFGEQLAALPIGARSRHRTDCQTCSGPV